MPPKRQTSPPKQPAAQKPKSEAGEVFVVGSGDCGQLGLGPDIFEKEKLAMLGYFTDKDIVSVYAGGLHNIALSAQGQLYSWGCNDQKALGRAGEETEPGLIAGLDGHTVVDVCCGDSVTCCLTSTGKVWAWGTFRCTNGIFGFAPGILQQDTPYEIPELRGIISIAAGTNHLVAIGKDGKIWTWGVGEQGQLGRKVTPRQLLESSLRPRTINFKPYRMTSKFVNVFCGAYHTFLVHESNALFAFGLNNYGQLGVGDTEEHESPQLVQDIPKDRKINQVAGGEHFSLLLDNEGVVYSFGRGDSGQLGFPIEHSQAPVALDLDGVKQISCGSAFSLAVTEGADNLWAWGYGEMGQLANESQDAPEPFEIAIKGRRVLKGAAGGQHSLLLLNKKGQE